MAQEKMEVKTPERQAATQAEQTRDLPVFSPLVDIYETQSEVVVFAEMPGVEQKNINVTFENDVLLIAGTPSGGTDGGHELLHRGRRIGSYYREFRILVDIDSEKISAKTSNGVLKIVLPKAEKAKPRKIEVLSA